VALRVRPLTLSEANAHIASLHRHHKPVQGHRFSLGVYDGDKLVGVAVCGRPVSRGCDYRTTLEVTRLCTDGTKNACSFLYSAAARVGREMGFDKIQTYILEEEPGVSLRASGWSFETNTTGGQWSGTNGKPRRTDQPTGPKQRWSKQL